MTNRCLVCGEPVLEGQLFCIDHNGKVYEDARFALDRDEIHGLVLVMNRHRDFVFQISYDDIPGDIDDMTDEELFSVVYDYYNIELEDFGLIASGNRPVRTALTNKARIPTCLLFLPYDNASLDSAKLISEMYLNKSAVYYENANADWCGYATSAIVTGKQIGRAHV